MEKITSIRITKSTHKELIKVMGKIQAKTGEIPTLDDALRELLENYKKKKSRKWILGFESYQTQTIYGIILDPTTNFN